VFSTNDPTAHAEVVAIRRTSQFLGSFQLNGCVIYTSCEPCPMCLGAIYWARLAKIYYGCTRVDAAQIGFDDNLIYREFQVPLCERRIPMEGLPSHEALQLLWSGAKSKTGNSTERRRGQRNPVEELLKPMNLSQKILARCLGTSAEFWLDLQAQYDPGITAERPSDTDWTNKVKTSANAG
jgi:hypothetical protein